MTSDKKTDNHSDSNSDMSTEDDSSENESDWTSDSSEDENENNEDKVATPADEDEEDEVIKAIVKSQEIQRNHPPTIQMEDFIVDICFHPDADIIAAADIMGDVHMYSYSNESTDLKSTLELHLKACRDIEFSSDGKTLYSTAKDLSIMLTDVETGKLTRLYENAHEQPVYKLRTIDDHMFATGDDSGVVKMWDLRQKESVHILSEKVTEDYVSDIITNNDKKYLVCASGDGSITTFNIPGKQLYVQSEEVGEELTSLGLFKSNTKLLATSSKGKMYVYNWGEFGLHCDEYPSSTKKAINCMIPITEDIAIMGHEDGALRAVNLFPYQHLGIVGQHELSVEAIDVNRDGTLIASCSHNNDIKFWNVHYFETLNINAKKSDKRKQLKHNLPSSKIKNTSDFFQDLQ